MRNVTEAARPQTGEVGTSCVITCSDEIDRSSRAFTTLQGRY